MQELLKKKKKNSSENRTSEDSFTYKYTTYMSIMCVTIARTETVTSDVHALHVAALFCSHYNFTLETR